MSLLDTSGTLGVKVRWLQRLGPILGLLLFSAALWALHQELRNYRLHEILKQLDGLPASRLLLATLLTVLSYFIMTGYDVLALRYIRHPLRYRRIGFASFVGYAFSNNIGLSMLAGGSVRYRLYSAWGLSVLEITKVVAFCTLTLWLGFMALGGLVFLFEPQAVPETLHLPFGSVRLLGGIFLMLVGAYLVLSLARKRPFKFKEWKFSLPPTRLIGMQMTVALLDWTLAGSVLYALLPAVPGLSYGGFLSVFLLAQMAGLLSQIPGGLGVFETVVVLLLSPRLPASAILGSLFAFRGIYYIFPLLAATALLGAQELLQKKAALHKTFHAIGRWGTVLVPPVMAFTTFVGGAILLFSGALPAIQWRMSWLKIFVPLPVMEASHFLGSLVGAALLVLARGLQRRIDAAYGLTVGLLGGGVVFSLLKGFDYEEALILSVMLAALLPCHRYFYRKASLLSQRFTLGWMAAIVLVLLSITWLGMFAYRHVEYTGDLWWRFTLHGDAPRFLRALVGAVGTVLFMVVARLLSPFAPKPTPAAPDVLARVYPIVQLSTRTYANLALLGDKSFLFNAKGNAFIMYSIQARSWVTMGDPVGPEEEWSELIWRFREMCDSYDAWTVFYQVGAENLPVYLDLGLMFLKLGEEGRVPLTTFSLEGGGRKGLRYTYHKLYKEGCRFEVVSPEELPELLPDLKGVSDGWLAEKNTREKRFSLGFFNTDYLKRYAVGIVRKEGQVIAFANVWAGAEKQELSVDLMRYLPEAPIGAMEYLFVQLMLWGKAEGYQWFNLGMAPLSGLEARAVAPLWNRMGAFVFTHGEHFYNLQGLRKYKEKFDPVWRPKYLAAPGGLALPRILTHISALISGGMRGVLSK